MIKIKFGIVCILTVVSGLAANDVRAQDNWYPHVIARGSDREAIKQLPIESRPNRPLHFYGNTVRRRIQRANPGPASRDLFRPNNSLIRRR